MSNVRLSAIVATFLLEEFLVGVHQEPVEGEEGALFQNVSFNCGRRFE